MPFNGSGTFTRTNGTNSGSTLWDSDRIAGTKITAGNHDTHDQDIATGLSQCMTTNGESTPTADIGFGGYRVKLIGAATAAADAIQCQQVQKGSVVYGGTSGGTANAQTITLSPAITSYTTGMRVVFIAGNTNTGAVTLNINSVAATAIRIGPSQTALAAGAIQSGNVVDVFYDGTFFRLVSPGHIPWTTWSPTYGATGSMTYGTITTAFARYSRVGNTIFFKLRATGTTGGSASSGITFTVPTTMASPADICFETKIVDGGSEIPGCGAHVDTSTLNVQKSDLSNWGTGASRTINAYGFYEAAA